MLIIENLTHIYPNGAKALDEVSLIVPKGMYGLLGPNGAGKSTLMRTIATLQAPTEGHVRFGDIDVLKDPEELRKTLGYLPQDFGVYPRVSAYDMLDHMAVLKGVSNGKERRETVEYLLNQTNLWAVRKRALAGFSSASRLTWASWARRAELSDSPMLSSASLNQLLSAAGCVINRSRSFASLA